MEGGLYDVSHQVITENVNYPFAIAIYNNRKKNRLFSIRKPDGTMVSKGSISYRKLRLISMPRVFTVTAVSFP